MQRTPKNGLYLLISGTYNTPMTTTDHHASKIEHLKSQAKDEARKAFFLTLYFAAWFCALTLLALTTLRERPIPIDSFVLAFIKAAVCAKFLLVGQAVFPIVIDKVNGLIGSLLRESFAYLVIVLALSYLESGVKGLIHGQNFIPSLLGFGGGDPLHILSLGIVYWLIIWPYLLLIGFKKILGDVATRDILLGPPKNT